jgi:hypothetical protein
MTIENHLRDLASFIYVPQIFPNLEFMRISEWDVWKVLQRECAERIKDWELGSRTNAVTKMFNSAMVIKRTDEIDDPVFFLFGQHSATKNTYIVVNLKKYLASVHHSQEINDFEHKSCHNNDEDGKAIVQISKGDSILLNARAVSIISNMQDMLRSLLDNVLVCCGIVESDYCAKLVKTKLHLMATVINKNQLVQSSTLPDLKPLPITLKYALIANTSYGGEERIIEFSNSWSEDKVEVDIENVETFVLAVQTVRALFNSELMSSQSVAAPVATPVAAPVDVSFSPASALLRLPCVMPLNCLFEESQRHEVELALNITGDDKKIISNKFGFEITTLTLKRLRIFKQESNDRPQDFYLNDELINSFMGMLSESDTALCKNDSTRSRSFFFNCYFMGKLRDGGFQAVKK